MIPGGVGRADYGTNIPLDASNVIAPERSSPFTTPPTTSVRPAGDGQDAGGAGQLAARFRGIRAGRAYNEPMSSRQALPALIALSLLIACTASRKPSSGAWDGRRFDELKLQYMAALDDRPADETAVSLEIERVLGAEVDAALKAHASGALATDDVRAQAGLVLVYDALLLQRNSAHALRGKIDRAALPGNTEARRHRAVELLDLARTLRPEDRRIDSWLAATQGMADLAPDGSLTGARKEQILAAVDIEPSFNLFTA